MCLQHKITLKKGNLQYSIRTPKLQGIFPPGQGPSLPEKAPFRAGEGLFMISEIKLVKPYFFVIN